MVYSHGMKKHGGYGESWPDFIEGHSSEGDIEVIQTDNVPIVFTSLISIKWKRDILIMESIFW